jgi:hypothetical protein
MGWLSLGMRRSLTNQEFIDKANKRHNNKYDYSLTRYTNNRGSIDVICPAHGIFTQVAHNHLVTSGCYKCGRDSSAKKQSNSHEDFLYNLKSKFSILDYKIISNYRGMQLPIYVEDNFGSHKTTPEGLLKGCKLTIQSAIDKTDYFIKKSILKHGEKYSYENTLYSGSSKNLSIRCKKHNYSFDISPTNHFRGTEGCSKCNYEKIAVINAENSTGWGLSKWKQTATTSKTFNSFKLYFLKLSDNTESFYKIGRTYRELSERTRKLPYTCETIHLLEHTDPKIIFDLEAHLKRTFKTNKYTPLKKFNGMGECFKFDDSTIESIKRQMTLTSSSDIIPTSS